MTGLVEVTNSGLPTDLAAAVEKAAGFAEAAKADNTRRAYAASWADFEGWCAAKGLVPLPATPSLVGVYLADRAESLKYSTLSLRLAAISSIHKDAGHALDTRAPQIRNVLRGIARRKGAAPAKKSAATSEILRDAVRAYANGDRRKCTRDRALLTIGFFGALRRSELVGLDVEHITVTPEGLLVHLLRRKTDQEGSGTLIGLPAKTDKTLCPVAAYTAWLAASGVISGPAFRSISKGDRVLEPRLFGRDVARIVKSATAAAGYDETVFAAHSLRSGFITTAARAGVPDRVIMKQSGHRSLEQLHGYVRSAGVFVENAAAMI